MRSFRARRHVATGLAVLAFASFTLAACGSDNSGVSAEQAAEAKAVLAVGNKLQAAYKGKDVSGMCALLDPKGMKREFGGRKGCERRLGAAMNKTGNNTGGFTFKEITVTGDEAVARNATGQGGDVFFRKAGGKWYVDLDPHPTAAQQQ